MLENVLDEAKCKKCDSAEDILMTEDGELLCDECLFEYQCDLLMGEE